MDIMSLLTYKDILETHDFQLPLDHAYESAFELYEVVPLLFFDRDKGKWVKQTILCIPDDNSGLKKDIFLMQLENNWRTKRLMPATEEIWTNKEYIWNIPAYTYNLLRQRIQLIHTDETYKFRYLFHLRQDELMDALLVIDTHANEMSTFEYLATERNDKWMISPVVDNSRTMKQNLILMTSKLHELQRRFQPEEFSDELSDFEYLDTRDEDLHVKDFEHVEKKPKKVWKFIKNKQQQIKIKGVITEKIYEFCRQQGYEFKDN